MKQMSLFFIITFPASNNFVYVEFCCSASCHPNGQKRGLFPQSLLGSSILHYPSEHQCGQCSTGKCQSSHRIHCLELLSFCSLHHGHLSSLTCVVPFAVLRSNEPAAWWAEIVSRPASSLSTPLQHQDYQPPRWSSPPSRLQCHTIPCG